MNGYYKQKTGNFKLFSKALIKNTVEQDSYLDIMLFSKNDVEKGIQSPNILFDGKSNELILDNIISNFKVSKGKQDAYGATDIIEALDKAISVIRKSTAVIFLVTDNINDVSGTGGTGESSYLNTLDFYKRLRNDGNIKKILMFPVPDKLVEDGSVSNGYVVYGIVYSKSDLKQSELERYDKLLRNSGIKQKAITLKPLDIGTVVLIPKVTQSKIAPAKLYFDGKTLRGFDFEEGEKIKETFSDLSLKSNLFPYIIKSAKLDVKLENFTSSDYSVKSMGTQSISPSTVSNVSPEGEVSGFTIVFNLPEISPKFSLKTIFKEDFTIGGNLLLEVSQVDIVLDENYMNNFKELFALNSVPEIFQPVLKDKKIYTTVPLELKMRYGPWRIILLIGLLVLIGLAIIFILYLMFRKRNITVLINENEEHTFSLNAFSSFPVITEFSPELGKIKISLFGKVFFVNSKFTSSPSRKILLTKNIPVNIYFEDDSGNKSYVAISYKDSVYTDKSSSAFENDDLH
jgi:hypothetical protein